jgi:hypothetical protein
MREGQVSWFRRQGKRGEWFWFRERFSRGALGLFAPHNVAKEGFQQAATVPGEGAMFVEDADEHRQHEGVAGPLPKLGLAFNQVHEAANLFLVAQVSLEEVTDSFVLQWLEVKDGQAELVLELPRAAGDNNVDIFAEGEEGLNLMLGCEEMLLGDFIQSIEKKKAPLAGELLERDTFSF